MTGLLHRERKRVAFNACGILEMAGLQPTNKLASITEISVLLYMLALVSIAVPALSI